MPKIYLHFFEQPVCSCGAPTKWDIGRKAFREFCSYACMNACSDISRRREATNLRRFGTKNPNTLESVKAKKVAKFQANYGVDNPSQAKSVKDKKVATFRKHYGADHWSKVLPTKFVTDNPMHDPETVKRQQATNLERYGHKNAMLSPQVQEKMRETFIRNYGVDNPRKSDTVKSKVTAAYLRWISVPENRKTFVRSVMESPKRKDFAHYSAMDQHGVKHRVQGYERFVVEKFNPNVVAKVSTKVPQIPYNKMHYYFPDFVVTMKDGSKRVVEVKSMYTLCHGLETNLKKFRAARTFCRKHANVSFWLILSDSKGNFKVYRNPVKFATRCRDRGLGDEPRRNQSK